MSGAAAAPRIGVVGHVEWVDFAVVERLPVPGEILHARRHFALPGGGGAVAAVQGRRLAGHALFLTAVGDDELGRGAPLRGQRREQLGHPVPVVEDGDDDGDVRHGSAQRP